MRWVRKAGQVSDGRRSWRSRRARRVGREPVEEQSLNGEGARREIFLTTLVACLVRQETSLGLLKSWRTSGSAWGSVGAIEDAKKKRGESDRLNPAPED